MPDDRPVLDVLEMVAAHAPRPDVIETEWSPARAGDTLAEILGAASPANAAHGAEVVHEIPLHFLPTPSRHRRRMNALPLVAAAIVLVLIAGVLAAVAHSTGSGSGPQATAGGGAPFDPPAGLSDTALEPGKYYHQVDEQIELDADGNVVPNAQDAMVNRNYVSTAGEIVSIRTGSQNGCQRFAPSGMSNWEQPSVAFFAGLPTDVEALQTYLRNHVEGSSSHDEAVFVAVGDSLRTAGGLASPRLRAAMLAVLSRTAGVAVHLGQRDYLGRPAIRADFVDQKIRPGEVHAYYFDPTDFRFLAEVFAHNGETSHYSGPSPAYEASAGPANDPESLTGRAFVGVVRSAEVVDRLPTLPADCKTG